MRWRERARIILNIELHSQNLDWQKKIACRVGQRFFLMSSLTPRSFIRRAMAHRPENSWAQMAYTNTSVKEMFIRKFLYRMWRTIGAHRLQWLWPRRVPKSQLAV